MSEKKDSEILTPEFRENWSRSRRRHAALQKDMKELKSFAFIIEEEPEAGQREADGVVVAKLRSYRLSTADGTRYYTFSLAADNRVAQFQIQD
jgi:hypothetical protein